MDAKIVANKNFMHLDPDPDPPIALLNQLKWAVLKCIVLLLKIIHTTSIYAIKDQER